MGAHYGAVYVRDVGRRQVCTLLAQFAAEKNTRFLLAPAIRSWLGVYPKEYGADGEVAERIASAFDATVLHVYLHDDSLLGYSYFRGGRLIDEYCSDPEYFESISQAEKARLRGRPELLVDLLASPHAAPQLDAVLHPADGTLGLATFALKDFARLLNLPNACTCYEYLLEDGWVERITRWLTIRGLWRFQHVPDLRAERKARRHRLSRRAQSWQQLKRNGNLLAYQPGRVGWILNSEPHLCPNQAGDGFYVFSENERDSQIRELSPPWDVPRRASGLVIDATRSVMALSPSGRWLAIGHGYEPGHTELHDRLAGSGNGRASQAGGSAGSADDHATGPQPRRPRPGLHHAAAVLPQHQKAGRGSLRLELPRAAGVAAADHSVACSGRCRASARACTARQNSRIGSCRSGLARSIHCSTWLLIIPRA